MQTLKCCPQPNTDTITTVYSNKKQGVPRTIYRSIITSGVQYLRLAGQACTRITELQNAIERVRMLARSASNQMYRLLHFQCTGGSFAMWCWHLALLLSVSRTKSAPCLRLQMRKKATPASSTHSLRPLQVQLFGFFGTGGGKLPGLALRLMPRKCSTCQRTSQSVAELRIWDCPSSIFKVTSAGVLELV